MNLIKQITPNKWIGGNRMEVLIVHWWDEPHKKPSLGGVVSWLMNPSSQVSAHYVVSDKTVYQLAEENDKAWHALQANDFAIGIEIDPNTPGDTYKTAGELVRAIRSRRGELPLKRHSDYVNTGCPGSIDLDRIDRESKRKEEEMVSGLGVDYLFRSLLGRTCDPQQKKDLMNEYTFDELEAWVKQLPEYKKKVKRAGKGDVYLGDYLPQDFRASFAKSVNVKDLKPGIYKVK
jgi:hypothetical protein